MEFVNSLLFMLGEMSPYILLGFLIAGVMHAFISRSVFSRHLSGKGWRPVVKAALIGVPLPLCSCGVLPTAIAMRRGGASKAASTSFLIATPQTGVDSIAATWSLLGPAFALVRPLAALVTSFFGGVAVGTVEQPDTDKTHIVGGESRHKVFWLKCKDALRYGFVDLVQSIGGWLVIGLVIAAVITVYVPDDYFTALGDSPLLSMLVVLVVAVPMYVCATGSIPIAMSLMLKGLSPGTALVLLMAGPAANFASFTLISREMGRKTAWLYLASIVTGAVAFGLVVDYLLPDGWFALPVASETAHHGVHCMGWIQLVGSVILAVLLGVAFVRNRKHNHLNINSMTRTYKVKGMNCPHCQAAVTRSIEGVKGVRSVSVSLSDGRAAVEGDYDEACVVAAVESAGFTIDAE